TQFIFGVRDEVAGKLGLPPDKVRVVCEFMGGGFGSKNGAGDYTFIAIELAKRTGRPVRCALTRREENLATGNRNATIPRLPAAEVPPDHRELRPRNYASASDGKPYSSKNLMECYRRAEQHWQRRDQVRARSERPWKRGVGLASQIW